MKGFTLVELVIVIAILMIMAAIAAPRFVSSDAFDTRAVLGQVISTLRYAQKTAITQRRTVYAQLDSASNRLKLCYSNTCDSLLQDPVSSESYSIALPPKVLVNPSLVTLGFTLDGTPTPNVSVTYVITNSQNLSQTNTVVVEANTGYVHKQ